MNLKSIAKKIYNPFSKIQKLEGGSLRLKYTWNMGGLDEREIKILRTLREFYPKRISKNDFFKETNFSEEEVLHKVKLLEEKGLVELVHALGEVFPAWLGITPKGMDASEKNKSLITIAVSWILQKFVEKAAETIILITIAAILAGLGFYYF